MTCKEFHGISLTPISSFTAETEAVLLLLSMEAPFTASDKSPRLFEQPAAGCLVY
ncbi:hypothetical protein STRDD11_02020 [Streptococcus sp. DD11]|nr:hypothetical protein STRDD11_02020 [Streptococcus sp. DD11]